MLIRLFTLFFITQFTVFYSQNASYVINGDASGTNITGTDGTVDCNCFELTPSQQGQVGSVWNENKINLNHNHRIEFDLYFGSNNGGADGMVFWSTKKQTHQLELLEVEWVCKEFCHRLVFFF